MDADLFFRWADYLCDICCYSLTHQLIDSLIDCSVGEAALKATNDVTLEVAELQQSQTRDKSSLVNERYLEKIAQTTF